MFIYRNSYVFKITALVVVCLFLANDIAFGISMPSSELNKSALAPPLATKPPCQIIQKSDGSFDVVTNDDIIKAWDREPATSVQQGEAPGKTFRNRWAFVDVSYIIGQMLILTQEHKLQNPKDILIPLIKKHIRNRSGEEEMLLEGFNIDGIKEVREGAEVTGLSLPVTRNGQPAYRLIYNLQSGDTAILINNETRVYIRVVKDIQDILRDLSYLKHDVINSLGGFEICFSLYREDGCATPQLQELSDFIRKIFDVLKEEDILEKEPDRLEEFTAKLKAITKESQICFEPSRLKTIFEDAYSRFNAADRTPEHKEKFVDMMIATLLCAKNILSDYASDFKEPPKSVNLNVLLDSVRYLKDNIFRVAVREYAAGDIEIVTDEAALTRALINIVVNASDAISGNKGKGGFRIRTQLTGDKKYVEIILADTAGGISPETLPHIFERGFTTKAYGKGLGLAMTKEYIEKRCHGTIDVASEPGKGLPADLSAEASSSKNAEAKAGTTFTIRLPVSNEPSSEQATRLPVARRTQPTPIAVSALDSKAPIRLDAPNRVPSVAAQVVRRNAYELQKEIEPLLREVEEIAQKLLPQQPLTDELKQKLKALTRIAAEISDKVHTAGDRLDAYHTILLSSTGLTFKHYILTALHSIRTEVDCAISINSLDQDGIIRIGKSILMVREIFAGLTNLYEVRLEKRDENFTRIFVPGIVPDTKRLTEYPYLAISASDKPLKSENDTKEGVWVTNLWNPEQCKESYLKFLDKRGSVNKWRLWASLAALSPEDQEAFIKWAGTLKDELIKDAESFARHNIHIGEAAKYMPASELWESVIEFDKGFDYPYQNDKERKLWLDMLMYANNNKLYAHGTANFFVRDGVDLISVSHHLQHHWALLNIMIEGNITEGDAGALDSDSHNQFHATYYGPFYVIFNRFTDDEHSFAWSSKNHAIYLVPREEAVVFLRKGLEEAVRLGLTTEENANEALSKVMTYKQFVDNHERIKDIIAEKVKPADIIVSKQTIINSSLSEKPAAPAGTDAESQSEPSPGAQVSASQEDMTPAIAEEIRVIAGHLNDPLLKVAVPSQVAEVIIKHSRLNDDEADLFRKIMQEVGEPALKSYLTDALAVFRPETFINIGKLTAELRNGLGADLPDEINTLFSKAEKLVKYAQDVRKAAEAAVEPVPPPAVTDLKPQSEPEPPLKPVVNPESERIHATNFQDMLTYIQVQPQAQPLIIALGTGWIKGYEKGRYLQYDALNPLIGSLRAYCESKGIPFIVDDDDKLPARINAERDREGKAGAKVIVLAGKDAAASDEFTALRNDEKNSFVVGVDNNELTTDSYIRLMEMLTIALKLSAGLEVSQDATPIKIMKDDKLHIYILIPPARPMDYEQQKAVYEVQKFV